MTTESTSPPTGMPGEEAIARAIYEAGREWWPEKPQWEKLKSMSVYSATSAEHYFIMARAVLALLPSEKGLKAGRPEPFLPAELEDTADGTDADWNAKALDALAAQLGYGNDFYYPLIGAAQELRQQREAIARSLSPAD